MTKNLYFPYDEEWFGFGSLYSKSTLDSSNTRIYLGKINWPHAVGDGSVKLNIEEYKILNQSLPPSKIILPRDYKTRVNDNTNMFQLFNGRVELAASLVLDEVESLINQTGRIAQSHPHSLYYLLDFNESKRELLLFPNLILFHKKFRE